MFRRFYSTDPLGLLSVSSVYSVVRSGNLLEPRNTRNALKRVRKDRRHGKEHGKNGLVILDLLQDLACVLVVGIEFQTLLIIFDRRFLVAGFEIRFAETVEGVCRLRKREDIQLENLDRLFKFLFLIRS